MGLRRPEGLGDAEWQGIREAEERLLRAMAADDQPLVVGSAKELCEAIGKVVIAARGDLAAAAADLPEVIGAAHRLLDFQPGQGLALEPEARRIAQGLKSMVLGIGEMRNRHGTGHGRAVPSGITSEHAELAFDAANLWSGWALRRLEPYMAGDVSAIVRDLEGNTFRSGDLGRRLRYAGLPNLPVEDQWRLGFAVAGRASRGTFTVTADGVDAVQADDEATWPPGYVEGLITGLFFDANGYLDVSEWKARESGRLIAALRGPEPLLRQIAEKAATAAMGGAVSGDEGGRHEAARELRRIGPLITSGEGRKLWEGIARTVESDMDEMRQLGLLQRFQEEADPKAGWQEGPEPDDRGGHAIRDYEGEPVEYEGPQGIDDDS
jgi:hypothetical protein